MIDPTFTTREELSDDEIEAALHSEGIYTWGPDGERFERMFSVVMEHRRVTLAHGHLFEEAK